MRWLWLMVLAGCGSELQIHGEPIDEQPGDPIVSCESTLISYRGDCDPNRKECLLLNGSVVVIQGSRCWPEVGD